LRLVGPKPPAPEKAKGVTTCPDCGSAYIEWKLSMTTGIGHKYVCHDCGYIGFMIIESDPN
jgi:predicted RNA-binding Zn-ribbon protein involved in translation (DUF1610 family)